MQSLVLDYGATAVRLWILTIANPAILYSTNPSTLSTFLDDLATEWQRSAKLIQDWCRQPEVFDRAVHTIANRLESCGSNRRLEKLRRSMHRFPYRSARRGPGVHLLGGWLCQTVLDRLAARAPTESLRLIPMYSMSTETLENGGPFARDKVAFLPLARRVLYEFIEEGAQHKTQTLLTQISFQ